MPSRWSIERRRARDRDFVDADEVVPRGWPALCHRSGVDYEDAGATVPLLGFGYALARGAIEGVKETGILGAFTGGVTAAAGGIAAAVFFGYPAAVLFKPKMKS